MRFLKPACAFLIAALFCVPQPKASPLSLYGETYPFTYSQLFVRNNTFAPNTNIGVGIDAGSNFSIGLEGGFYYNSGSKDTAESSPEVQTIYLGIAPLVQIVSGEKASLGLYLKGGVNIITASASDFGISGEHYETYSLLAPMFGVGFQPSLNLSPNLSLYSSFGVKVVSMPDGKTIDRASPVYNPTAGVYPLKTVKDGTLSVSTEGLALGLRYHF